MTNLEKERTEEINAIIKELTLEEKVGLMLHESIGVPRLGIKDYNWWNECLHGVARAGTATVFPQTIGLAATFYTELAKKVATESIVLLKNKNGLLPIKNDVKKIVVMGPVATNVDALIGNYFGLNSKLVTILEGLLAKTENRQNINIDYTPAIGMYHESKQRGWTLGMAETADIVIACFGLDTSMEGEEGDALETVRGDRDFIELPKHQLDYLQAVHDRGTPVVLVLTGGSPIAFPYDIADAILFAWYPGEEGGNAVADIIFGEASPSGHLPVTFPKATTDLPAFDDYSMKNRTYRYAQKEPLFPFGFGLSYTQFSIKNAKAKKTNKNVKIECEVQNIGNFDAKEVIQVYISKANRTDNEPICSLRDFTKIFIESGKTKTVHFELPLSAFETITQNGNSVLEKGKYIITLADSSPNEISLKLGATKPISLKIEI